MSTFPPPCRVFPFRSDDGPANMAADDALLELVAAEPTAALRAYGWTTPTLSLGYFQSIADAETDPRWRDLPVVRRPTGGGALLHDHELTYALAIPADHPLGRHPRDLYRAVHDAIAVLLREQGVEAHRRGDPGVKSGEARPFLCFADRDTDDIVVGPMKVVGSAQRRRGGAVLQHGSVLLRRSPFAPALRGIADLTEVDDNLDIWSERLVAFLPRALGLTGARAFWPPDVAKRAEVLERSVYRSDAWMLRR